MKSKGMKQTQGSSEFSAYNAEESGDDVVRDALS